MLQQLKSAIAAVLPDKKNPPPVASAPKAKAKPDSIETELLIAWAMPKKNLRLLVAYRPHTDPTNPTMLVSVRVASNVHFMRGQQLKAHHVGNNVFDLVGPTPLARGRKIV